MKTETSATCKSCKGKYRRGFRRLHLCPSKKVETPKTLVGYCKHAGRGPWVMDLPCLFGTMSSVEGGVQRKKQKKERGQ